MQDCNMTKELEDRIKKLEERLNGLEAGKKVKKKREGPPRPPTAYQKFFKEERPKVVKEYPDYDNTKIFREIGKRWKAKQETNE